MIIYALKTCDTCRKAISALRGRYPDLQVVDVRSDGVPREKLQEFSAAFGDALINRASATWRGLDEAERGKNGLELLEMHPTLMKRPVVEHKGQLFLGWKPDVQSTLLGDQ